MPCTVPLGQRLGYPRQALTVPRAPAPTGGRFRDSCRATIDNVAAPCPNSAGPGTNYVCQKCEARTVHAMHATLFRHGEKKLALELATSLARREWNPYSLRMEVTQ